MYVFDSILGNGAQQCCGDLDNFLQVTPTAITTAVTTAITTAVNRKQHRGTELRAQSRTIIAGAVLCVFGVFVAVFASKVAMKSAGAEASSVSQWMVPPLHAGECSRIKIRLKKLYLFIK